MPFSRLSALVPPAVGHYLASTFSARHHPAIVRYRTILAQAFYHHGRLCASNQATVMVLVILFVSMISYPALVTYYNSYILATSSFRHHPPNSAASRFGRAHEASLGRSDLESGNLDEFWSGIIQPTWSQDPAMFQQTLPTKPMHYLAPVIINATDTSLKYENGAGPGILSDAEVLVYAADVQKRLQSISVELTEEMLLSQPSSSSILRALNGNDDPADIWEEEEEEGGHDAEEEQEEEEVEGETGESTPHHQSDHQSLAQQQQQQHKENEGRRGTRRRKKNARRARRKVSLRDICVIDPQSMHYQPADRGYARIWTEEEEQRRSGAGGAVVKAGSDTGAVDTLLLATASLSSSSAVGVALDMQNSPDSTERGRNIVPNEGHNTEDQSGTSFGNNAPNPHTTGQHSTTNFIPSPQLSLECLIQSPVAYWQNDIERIRADKDILGTISKGQNSTLPLSQSTLFGGRVLNQQTNKVQGATSIIMTFFLRGNSAEMYPEEHQKIYGSLNAASPTNAKADNIWRRDLDVVKVWTALFNAVMRDLRLEREAAWLKAHPQQHDGQQQQQPTSSVHKDDAVISTKTQEITPSVIMMKVSQDVELGHGGFKRLVSGDYAKPNTNISAEYWLLAMAYFVMFLYISLSVGRVDLVKSKYGLGIAAVATVFVSLIMSIGICSVFGVTLTLMPWEILPFMIIVVGVENINILVHAVVETSMDLPVKERVGRGLGAVGVSITMTLLAELCLLTVGAMTTIPAVQEFCTFAIAAVIMDYVLQMTFFITVISIDIRRLELTDLSATMGHRRRGVSFKYPYVNRNAHHHHHSHPHLFQYGPFSAAARGLTEENEAFAPDHPFLGRQRSGSNASADTDEGGKGSGKAVKKSPKGRIFTSIIMVGVMAYLGYIYGTTSQTLENESTKTSVSFWHIASPEVSSEFWRLVDPGAKGGYLEICPPMVLTMATPSYSVNGSECVLPPQSTTSECADDGDGMEVIGDLDGTTMDRKQGQGVGRTSEGGKGKKGKRRKSKGKKGTDAEEDFNDGTLDPRRPFKMLKKGIVFVTLFTFWLLRVFVIPSMTLAAAILVLLSYLLSPQRKLLVDLQWRFPFIVLPGDYQSKRQLMMDQLLAQEARELGLDSASTSVAPLPGTIETLKRGGHVTDIEQMDVNPLGMILSSSMDKKILLWHGGCDSSNNDHTERRIPLARLLSLTTTATTMSPVATTIPRPFSQGMILPGDANKRIVRCLKLDPLGRFAAAGYIDGGVHIWDIASVVDAATANDPAAAATQRSLGWVPELKAYLELQRHQTDASSSSSSTNSRSQESSSKDRVTALHFWNDLEEDEEEEDEQGAGVAYTTPSHQNTAPPPLLLVGYRGGQVCEWCPKSGQLWTSIQTKLRGGVSELAIVRLTRKTRRDLGLSHQQDKAYLVVGGKDGSVQCWVRVGRQQLLQGQQRSEEEQGSWQWNRIWSQPGDGSGSSVVVLSVDSQVPMVATGTANGAIKVWDLEQGNLIWTLSRGAVPSILAAAASHSPSPSFQHARKHSLGSSTFENHQPSHQAAVTKIVFKPLELEDGITGEPAPRVWLIISSSMDEAVMVWMVEWEGLLSVAASTTSASSSSTLISSIHPHDMPATGGAGVGSGQSSPLASPSAPPPMLRSSQRSSSHTNLHHLGTLSTSLPAPRLVGYMKQRGGKSIAIRHTSIFGVRRKENASLTNTGIGGGSGGGSILSSRKQSYASVLDAAGLSQHVSPTTSSGLRNRNKSETGSGTHSTSSSPAAGNNSTKRGWEVWEADLYQCIFKDPGVWGLDLAVRTIDLQPPIAPTLATSSGFNTLPGASSNISNGTSLSAPMPTSASSSSSISSTLTATASVGGAAAGLGLGATSIPMVTTNGSSGPVLVNCDATGSSTPKPKLRRRPGSFANNTPAGLGPSQGYVYSMADHQQQQSAGGQQHLFSTASGRILEGSSSLDPWDSSHHRRPSFVVDEPMLMEEPEPDLLPFVETRYIFAVEWMPPSPPAIASGDQPQHQSPTPPSSSKSLPPAPPQLSRWPSEHNVQTLQQQQGQQQQQSEMGGIVVGFGNWIKVVRLQEEDDDYDHDDMDGQGFSYGYDDGHPYYDVY